MKENSEVLARQTASAVSQRPTIELVTPPKLPSVSAQCPMRPPGLPGGPCLPSFAPRPTPCIPACSPACIPSSIPRGCMPDYLKPTPPKPPRPS